MIVDPVLVHQPIYASLRFGMSLKILVSFFKTHMTKFSQKKGHKYNTRLQFIYKNISPGVQVKQLKFLSKDITEKVPNYKLYSIPKRFRKPGKLDWKTPRGKIIARGFGYIPEPPVLEIKFEKPVVPDLSLSFVTDTSFWV